MLMKSQAAPLATSAPDLTDMTAELRALALSPLPQVAAIDRATRRLAQLNAQADDPIATQSVLMGLRALWNESSDRQELAIALTAELAAQSAPNSYASRHLCHEWRNMMVATPAASAEDRFSVAVATFRKAAGACLTQAAAQQAIAMSEQQPRTAENLETMIGIMDEITTYAATSGQAVMGHQARGIAAQMREALHLR